MWGSFIMPNRLANELSPYLLQHAENPVDWYPWGEEALNRAKSENKPIFLSIGYSACHWCHVMAYESFEDEEIAQLLNESFIPIKVDREERPDLDQLYMQAAQAFAGHGGWPLSVFLTPDLQPFFAGTYWPPRTRGQMLGFDEVLRRIDEAWRERRDQVHQVANSVETLLKSLQQEQRPAEGSLETLAEQATETLRQAYDPDWGGFGHAPKFPHSLELRYLLRRAYQKADPQLLRIVKHSLSAMAAGGIYDHLGGGFHRYSVDHSWTVPHFEKMLYDNALLALANLDAWKATGEECFRQTAEDTLVYMLRDLRLAEGTFASSEDADSEGEEGRFYLWLPEEITEILGPELARLFMLAYTSPRGWLEGKMILHRTCTRTEGAAKAQMDPDDWERAINEARRKLFEKRNQRVRPGRDDKVIVAWNALAISALARAGAAFGNSAYLQAAVETAEFIFGRLWTGRSLHRCWREGRAFGPGFLDDYAGLAWACINLFETTQEGRWLDRAVALAEIILERFSDSRDGGFYYSADDAETPIARPKEFFDGSTPSSHSMATGVLGWLGHMLQRGDFRKAAQAAMEAGLARFPLAPSAMTQLLSAVEWTEGEVIELVLVGSAGDSGTQSILQAFHRKFIPNARLLCVPPKHSELDSEHLKRVDWIKVLIEATEPQAAAKEPILYICRNRTCELPARGVESALEAFGSLERPIS